MFDAGAIVGRIKLNKEDFDRVAQEVESKVASLGETVSKTGLQLATVSRQIQIVGRNLTFLGAGVVAPMVLAFKSAEKYSNLVRTEMERLNSVAIQMRISVGESLVPVMHRFSNILADLLQRWNSLSPAMRESILQTTFMVASWTLLSGLGISLVSKIGQLVGKVVQLSGAILTFAAVHPQILLVVAALAGVSYAITKIGGLSPVLNWFEKVALNIAAGWTKVAKAMWDTLSITLRIQDPFGMWSRKLQDFTQQMQSTLTGQLEGINKRILEMANGNDGAMATFVDDIKEKITTIKDLFSNLGATEFNLPNTIFEASQSFEEGWMRAIQKANNDLNNWGATATNIVTQTTLTMQNAFSNLFQNVLKGNLDDAKSFFVEWGNFCLKIIGDVIAQIITAKIIGAAMGLFSSGLTANVSGMGSIPVAPPNYYLGHDEGISKVPSTGVYKLHEGEKVVPKYDANNDGRAITVEIVNVLSDGVIAAGMGRSKGRNTILNIINENSMRNGVVRREVVRR